MPNSGTTVRLSVAFGLPRVVRSVEVPTTMTGAELQAKLDISSSSSATMSLCVLVPIEPGTTLAQLGIAHNDRVLVYTTTAATRRPPPPQQQYSSCRSHQQQPRDCPPFPTTAAAAASPFSGSRCSYSLGTTAAASVVAAVATPQQQRQKQQYSSSRTHQQHRGRPPSPTTAAASASPFSGSRSYSLGATAHQRGTPEPASAAASVVAAVACPQSPSTPPQQQRQQFGVFVRNLPPGTTNSRLQQHFQQYRPTSATVCKGTSQQSCFGFVYFSSESDLAAASSGLADSEIDGRRISVETQK